MNDLIPKLRNVYLPFVIVSIAVIVFYPSLHWLLVIKNQWLTLPEFWTNYVIPVCFVFIITMLLLRPNMKLLEFKRKNGKSWIGFYIYMAVIIITIPLLISISYLETATGKLTKLNSIDEIDHKPKTKYYTVKNFYINKIYSSTYRTSKVTGKQNGNLDYYIYIACPILSSLDTEIVNQANDPPSYYEPKAWIGVRYTMRISNQLSDKDKSENWKRFGINSYQDYTHKNLNEFIYLKLIGNNKDRDRYYKAIKQYHVQEPIVLEAINEPFEHRNGNKLLWIFVSFSIGMMVWLFLVLIRPLNDQFI